MLAHLKGKTINEITKLIKHGKNYPLNKYVTIYTTNQQLTQIDSHECSQMEVDTTQQDT